MNYNEYMANIKAYKAGTLLHAEPTDAVTDWHEKYFDTAVSALSKKMVADHVEHSEDADRFGKDFVSLVAILEEDGVSKQDIGKELEAVSKAAQSQADAAIKKLDAVQHSTDTFEGYQAAIKAYKETHLEHAEWKKHKYIRIENGRYIYPDDLKKTNNNSSRNNQVPLNKQISNKITSTLSNLTPKKTTTAPTSPASRDQISGEKYVKNKLNDIATGFKNIAKSVQDYRSEKAEGPKVEEYVKTADGRTISKKEWEDELRKNIAETDRQYHEQKQKKAENEARKAAREATEKEKQAQEKEREFKETAAKIEQEQAEKAAAERKEVDQKQALKDVKNRNIGMQIDRAGEKADQKKAAETETPGISKLRDMSVDAQEKAKKAAEEKVQAKKNEYLELGKKNGLTDSDVDDFIKTAEYNYNWRKNTAMDHATSRAKDYGDDYTVKLEPHEHGSMEDIVIYRPDGSKLGKFVSIENLESDIQNQLSRGKESPYYKQKFHHSDPRAAFYAAVDEYKSKKGLNQRVPL